MANTAADPDQPARRLSPPACGLLLRSGMDTALASAKAVSMAKGSAVASRAEPATRPVPTPLLNQGGKTPLKKSHSW